MGMLDNIVNEFYGSAGTAIAKAAIFSAEESAAGVAGFGGAVSGVDVDGGVESQEPTGSTIGLSNFERQQVELRIAQADQAAHAFDDDDREYGWFDPREWFAFVEMAAAFNGENQQSEIQGESK